jgi:dienelactone hydrolase
LRALLLLLITSCALAQDERSVKSPDGQIQFTIGVTAQEGRSLSRAAYEISYAGKQVVNISFLGLDIWDQEPLLGENTGLIASRKSEQPLYNTLVTRYMQNGSLGRLLEVEIRVYNDGVAFRYIIPRSILLQELLIAEEATEFASNEISVTEVQTADYPAMRLVRSDGGARMTRIGTSGAIAYRGKTPFTGPWRMMQIGPNHGNMERDLRRDISYFSVPPADAPELAPRGPYGVGVRTVDVVNPGQIDILKFDIATGKAPTYDRPLTLEVWYPAAIPADRQEHTTYQLMMPRGTQTFTVDGKALRDAVPMQGKQFPLVVVSHGYPGSRYFLSYLTENLASKGYVVVAIDHTDSVFGAEKPFPSTLLNRASDQVFTLDAVGKLPFLNGVVDASRAAIIGYSMGGYGVLASAGAGYSKQAAAERIVPGGYFDAVTAPRRRDALKAIVAIAPWGNQPPINSWDAEALARIRIPSLFIAGDHDDVSDFQNGIKPAFEKAVNSDRCMLVYENALHNVGGNPPPPEALGSFTTREFFDEPVWKKERISAINQHFVTAFLDLYLKGDESKRAYLHTVVEKSNDGKWPLKPGETAGAKFSDGSTYWKGFQRRWALGLEMHCSTPK